MSRTLPTYWNMRELFINGRRKWLDSPPFHIAIPPYDSLIPRPHGKVTSSALGIQPVSNLFDVSCYGGPEFLDWHPASAVPNGKCLRSISILSTEVYTLPLVILDREGVGCKSSFYHHNPCQYLLSLPLQPGLNHLLYCMYSRIQLIDYRSTDEMDHNLDFMHPSIHGPTLYIPKTQGESLRNFSLSYDSYTEVFPSDANWHAQPIPNKMADYQVELAGGAYPTVYLFSTQGTVLPLWVWSKLAAGVDGFRLGDSHTGLHFPPPYHQQHYSLLRNRVVGQRLSTTSVITVCCADPACRGSNKDAYEYPPF